MWVTIPIGSNFKSFHLVLERTTIKNKACAEVWWCPGRLLDCMPRYKF